MELPQIHQRPEPTLGRSWTSRETTVIATAAISELHSLAGCPLTSACSTPGAHVESEFSIRELLLAHLFELLDPAHKRSMPELHR